MRCFFNNGKGRRKEGKQQEQRDVFLFTLACESLFPLSFQLLLLSKVADGWVGAPLRAVASECKPEQEQSRTATGGLFFWGGGV